MQKHIKICPDCGAEIVLNSDDCLEGSIIACHCCGCEFEYRGGQLKELVLEGEDWGE